MAWRRVMLAVIGLIPSGWHVGLKGSKRETVHCCAHPCISSRVETQQRVFPLDGNRAGIAPECAEDCSANPAPRAWPLSASERRFLSVRRIQRNADAPPTERAVSGGRTGRSADMVAGARRGTDIAEAAACIVPSSGHRAAPTLTATCAGRLMPAFGLFCRFLAVGGLTSARGRRSLCARIGFRLARGQHASRWRVWGRNLFVLIRCSSPERGFEALFLFCRLSLVCALRLLLRAQAVSRLLSLSFGLSGRLLSSRPCGRVAARGFCRIAGASGSGLPRQLLRFSPSGAAAASAARFRLEPLSGFGACSRLFGLRRFDRFRTGLGGGRHASVLRGSGSGLGCRLGRHAAHGFFLRFSARWRIGGSGVSSSAGSGMPLQRRRRRRHINVRLASGRHRFALLNFCACSVVTLRLRCRLRASRSSRPS